MKRTYRAYSDTPPYNILYIYTVSFGNSGLAGFATFPWDLPANPDIDGVVIDVTTLPGFVPDNVYSSGTTGKPSCLSFQVLRFGEESRKQTHELVIFRIDSLVRCTDSTPVYI